MTPTLGATTSCLWMVTASQCGVLSDQGGPRCALLNSYYDPEDLFGEEWELNNNDIAALDLQGAASPMEVEGELPDMNGLGRLLPCEVVYPTLLPPRVAFRYHLARVWS